jgi:predicted tellurium resistance membrane protein TerC
LSEASSSALDPALSPPPSPPPPPPPPSYILEQSLSVDNLFVFVLVFNYFKTPPAYQPKVLTYGIATAAVLRLVMVLLGTELVQQFEPVLVLFAGVLLWSAWGLLVGGDDDDDGDLSDNAVRRPLREREWGAGRRRAPTAALERGACHAALRRQRASAPRLEAHPGPHPRPRPPAPPKIVKFCRKLLPVTDYYDGDRFFTSPAAPPPGAPPTPFPSPDTTPAATTAVSRLPPPASVATPLLLALAVVEISDVVFAVDSIPAVFGVTLDPFIVYSSNMFAILSLRSLYSFVSTIMTELRYLDKAVAVVLAFIGGKMIAEFAGVEVPTDVSLLVVGVVLGGGVAASLLLPDDDKVE